MNERPIGYVVDKVAEWRKIFIDGRSNERLSLVEAAELVGISKKSLDDYTLHIRKGFKYFFNFNENRHSKIGVLRDFVKKHEQAVKEEEEQIRELSLKKKQSLRPSSSTTSKNNRGPPTGKSWAFSAVIMCAKLSNLRNKHFKYITARLAVVWVGH